MNIAFIIDPIDTLNIAKDSSFAMMEADKGKTSETGQRSRRLDANRRDEIALSKR